MNMNNSNNLSPYLMGENTPGKRKKQRWKTTIEKRPQLADVRLMFHPQAWLKLQYCCHAASTEIGGFGVCTRDDDPLYVEDFLLPRQKCTDFFCDLDMEDASARLEDYITRPGQRVFGTSVWIHTHPNIGATPTFHDEQTFADRRGDWALMCILCRSGKTSCRLRVNTPLGEVFREIPVVVDGDFSFILESGVVEQWAKELEDRVVERLWQPSSPAAFQKEVPSHALAALDDSWQEWQEARRMAREEEEVEWLEEFMAYEAEMQGKEKD